MSQQNDKIVQMPASKNVEAEREQVFTALVSALKDLRAWQEMIGGKGLSRD